MTEYSDINPQAVEVKVGTRRLRTILLFPLSLGDQLELTDVLAESIGGFLDSQTNEVEMVTFIVDQIRANLVKILELSLDEGEQPAEVMKEITNAQSLDIVNHVFEMNYGENLKNAKSLFGKIKSLFLIEKDLSKLSPQSANGTDTDLETSSNPSEGAD